MNNLSNKIKLIKRNKIKDPRGWFLKSINGLEEGLPRFTGEIYVVCSMKGSSRGGHFHKKATEWFTIIEGQSMLKLQDIHTKECVDIFLKSSDPITVVVPPLIAHQFDAVNDEKFMILAYTNVLYDSEDTIQIKI